MENEEPSEEDFNAPTEYVRQEPVLYTYAWRFITLVTIILYHVRLWNDFLNYGASLLYLICGNIVFFGVVAWILKLGLSSGDKSE